MAYQAPAFYYYHAAREASAVVAPNGAAGSNVNSFFDSRQGEAYVYNDTLTNLGSAQVQITRSGGAERLLTDHVIISGHNFNGAEINVFGASGDLLIPDHTVTEANGEPISISLDTDNTANLVTFVVLPGTAGAVVPQMSELFYTTEHIMSRGPRPDFDTSWRRNQQRFVNDAGVSSTFLQGAARKTYTLTWQNLIGADRQIILDMRDQTSDWSNPFFFRPPDDTFPIVFVELDRDATFVQDFDNPLGGTSDRVTLNMIEVLG